MYAKANAVIIGEIYVSTNCEKIKAIAMRYGAKVIDRPTNISGDFEPTVSALKHVLQSIEAVENVILLQPTNPLRPEKVLHEAFEIFTSQNHDSLFTVSRNQHKLVKIIDKKFIPFNYEIGQSS